MIARAVRVIDASGEGLHGPQELVQLPIRFLSVLAHGDDDVDPGEG